MKVLLLDQIPEVNNKYTFSLANGIKKNGVDIVIAGISSDDISEYNGVEYLPIFEPYSNIHNPACKIISYKKSWDRILKYCLSNKIDVVHVQWYIFSPLDYRYHRILQKNGIKVVTTIHDLLPFNKKFYDFHYHKKIYQNANAVISQAKDNLKELTNTFDVDESKISYIPHGHYMEYAEKATREESRKYLKIDNNDPIVLFFGQIKKVKGVDVLISAMSIVHEKYPNVKCIIAGKVWKDNFEEYEQQIKKLKLSHVIRTDIKYIPDDEIKYYFNAADIVALPYRKIYQSGCVLLAYAYKKPVVATTEGEFLSVVNNGKTGILVPAGDAEKLADAICFYLKNPKIAEKFAIDGYNDLSVRLSWDNIGKKVDDLYKKILN